MHISKVRLRRLFRVLLRPVSLAIIFCVVVIVYLTISKLTHRQNDTMPIATPLASPSIQTEILPKTVNAGLPVRLKIPKINVDANIDHIGLTPRGDLAAPNGPANAGWYTQSPRPGDSGNAVLDGHFGYRDRIPAVFDNLHTLQPGDDIYVVDELGVTTAFKVRALQTFNPNDDTTIVFRPDDGGEHLNLVTCQGVWNAAQKSYATRLVVFADKHDL